MPNKSLRQLEQDLEIALQEEDASQPKVIYLNDDVDTDGISILKVSMPFPLDMDIVGIPLAFELTKLGVMEARALAFGYTLVRRY